MDKNAPINKAGKAGKVLPDQRPAAPVATGPKAKTVKDGNVKAIYVDANGAETKMATAVGITFEFKGVPDKQTIILNALTPEMLMQAALFGLNTAGRNAFNTTFAGNGHDFDDALDKAMARINGIRDGVWASQGGGASTTIPLIIEAMEAALTKAGVFTPEKKAAWLATWRGLPDAKAQNQQQAEWLKKTPIKAAYEKLKAERAAERAKKAAGATGDTDLSDL